MYVGKVIADVNSIVAELMEWRISSTELRKGEPVPFVRALRFTALLTYLIRDMKTTERLRADWGHIVVDGQWCTRECDIIIYEGEAQQWDGTDNSIMNFKFVPAEQALVVISCKTSATSRMGRKELKKYYADVRPHVEEVWLFAECCWAKDEAAAEALESKLRDAPVCDRFYYLYRLYENQEPEKNESGWIDFGGAVQELCAKVRE